MTAAAPTQKPDIAALKDVCKHFPIGANVNYYPEYQTSMTMQSVILGYEINDVKVFIQHQIETEISASSRPSVTLKLEQETKTFHQLDSFCLLLPANAGEEYKLNFISKSSLGNKGQFRHGNSISLVAPQNQGVAMLETTVREVSLAKEGFFKGHYLAILKVISNSLEFAELRNHYRVNTRIPIKLKSQDTPASLAPALLCDYSEQYVRIKVSNDEQIPARFAVNSRISFVLVLEQSHKTFELNGRIHRAEMGYILVEMQQISTNGSTQREFGLMDALSLKAGILQHPNTQG